MKIVFTIDGERKEVDVKSAMLYDASGNRYRISEDFEHGLEILAEDGKAYIEPHVSKPLRRIHKTLTSMTKKKQEDSGPSKGQLETIHRAEYLIESSALDYYLKHEFYDVLLALASMHEQIGEESASNGYGFAMYIYNPSKLSEHFESTATGLGGFGAMINDAIRWIDEEIKTYGGESDFGSKITEVENPRLVDDELEDDPAILKNLMVFAEAWESLSVLFVNMGDTFSTTGWLNVYFEYFPNSDDMPDEIDMAIVEFKGCNQYPGGTLKMFSDEVEKMKAAIEGGPYPECPEPPEECEDDE